MWPMVEGKRSMMIVAVAKRCGLMREGGLIWEWPLREVPLYICMCATVQLGCILRGCLRFTLFCSKSLYFQLLLSDYSWDCMINSVIKVKPIFCCPDNLICDRNSYNIYRTRRYHLQLWCSLLVTKFHQDMDSNLSCFRGTYVTKPSCKDPLSFKDIGTLAYLFHIQVPWVQCSLYYLKPSIGS